MFAIWNFRKTPGKLGEMSWPGELFPLLRKFAGFCILYVVSLLYLPLSNEIISLNTTYNTEYQHKCSKEEENVQGGENAGKMLFFFLLKTCMIYKMLSLEDYPSKRL